MASTFPLGQHHYSHRIGWLRATVLGANDGILSTASLVIGVASAEGSTGAVLTAGLAGLVAGAMSMAAGEYVSVSSQADTEKADLQIEREALRDNPEAELIELAHIYMNRGVEQDTAYEVARQLTEKDALEAHARDELGINEIVTARPVQAAVSSALSFSAGSTLPLAAVIFAPIELVTPVVAVVSLLALILLGLASAKAGGASKLKAVVRIVFWGAAAMLVTGLIGAAFGTVV